MILKFSLRGWESRERGNKIVPVSLDKGGIVLFLEALGNI